MNRRFICMSAGYWGGGETVSEALGKLKKCSGKMPKDFVVTMFESELSFAPSDRVALDGESDCWVGKDGSMNWVRCERTQLG